MVLESCRCSTRPKASRRFLDCSSIYCNDRDEFDSSICRRFWTDLKKDSWIVGVAGDGWVEEEADFVCSREVASLVWEAVLRLFGPSPSVSAVVVVASMGFAEIWSTDACRAGLKADEALLVTGGRLLDSPRS